MDDVTREPHALTDVATLRARARRHIEEGAVTAGYTADREAVVKLLNAALATEIVCTLRYRRHYFMARGIHAATVAAEFIEHANQELSHADQLAERIAIDSYREMMLYIGERDPTTVRMLSAILAVEEEHADELSDLVAGLPASTT